MNGTILNISNLGSIVLLHVDTHKRRVDSIPVDHRAYQWILDGEDCVEDDLIGRKVFYDGESLEFVDE